MTDKARLENSVIIGLTRRISWPESHHGVLYTDEKGAKLHIVEGQAANLFIAPRAAAGHEWKLVKKGWFLPFSKRVQTVLKKAKP